MSHAIKYSDKLRSLRAHDYCNIQWIITNCCIHTPGRSMCSGNKYNVHKWRHASSVDIEPDNLICVYLKNWTDNFFFHGNLLGSPITNQSEIKKLMCVYGFRHVWLNQGVGDNSLFIETFKQRLIDTSSQDWHSDVLNSRKLELYSTHIYHNYHSKYILLLICITHITLHTVASGV